MDSTSSKPGVLRRMGAVGATLLLMGGVVVATGSPADATVSGFSFGGIADWDRDGHQDIIGRDDRTGLLWLYPGQSTRGYSSTPRIQIGNGWNGYTFAGIADWDRDGHQDIITRENASGLLWLYPGQSTRGYTSTPRTQIGNGWNGYTFAGIADWDRDGHQDIITRENASGLLWLYPGQSSRGYTSTPRTQIGNGWNGYTFAGIADSDRDGHQDIITRENASGLLWLYPGQSIRRMTTTPRTQIGNGWNAYTFAEIADWDRDGHQDIITRDNGSRLLWLYPGQSTRGYTSTPRIQIGNGW